MLTLGLSTFAAIDCVVVYDKNDDTSIIPIKDASEITFDKNIISIGSYSFNMDMLKKYLFSDSSQLGVEDIEGDISGLKIDPKGIITFDQSMAITSIDVWNVNGIAQPFNRSGNTIDFHSLPSNVYVIKIGQTSFKILKK